MDKASFIRRITEPSNELADRALCNETVVAMVEKLAAKRADGRGGWWECSATQLLKMAEEHLQRVHDDPLKNIDQIIDCINLLAMLRMVLEMEGEG